MNKRRKIKYLVGGSLVAIAGLALVSCGGNSDTKYTVSFEVNDPDTTDSITLDAINPVTVKKGSTVALTELTYDGYTFGGWFTDESLTNQFTSTSIITADTTLYAKWTKNSDANTTTITMNNVRYATIAAALAAIPTSGDTSTYTIYLSKGIYEEDGLAYNGSATVKISGVTTTTYGTDVIISGHGSNLNSEKGRSLLAIQGSGDIILENLTLVSDLTRANDNAGQCEVLGTDTTGNTVAVNCSFKSHQDTLRTAGKAWFYGCHIEGDVDFIWMEVAGTVALYEKCEIVSIYDSGTDSHFSYLAAPRMNQTARVGKGVVFFNSTVKESDEAKSKGQKTYLARTPWNSGVYNQVAYINTTCEDVETQAWYNSSIATDYSKTIIGFKMDQDTATSLGYAGNGDIISSTDEANEFSGRDAILNRVFSTAKSKYQKDAVNYWDINSLIIENGWTVDEDTSSALLDGEIEVATTTYLFDGSVDQSSICEGFSHESTKTHYKGSAESTITIPISGKSTIEVYGYYSGVAEVTAGTQGSGVMSFNNGSTNTELVNTYVVYDDSVESLVITAKSMTYITKIVVEEDSTITEEKVEGFTITGDKTNYCVGVALDLDATATNVTATNKSVKWTSSDTSKATIDEYTGAVTFIAAGEVTFTATALDGSNVTATFTCTAKEATWRQCEWYTKDSTLATETGAEEIANFSQGSATSSKSLSKAVSFKNLAGTNITTSYGLKLNGDGQLTISTTAAATLTIIIGPSVISSQAGTTAEPKVTDGTSVIASSSSTVSGDLTIYVFELSSAGTWNITRPGNKEVNPIVYAKCVYNVA